MELLLMDLSAELLHEVRKRAWEKHWGFRLRRGLGFRQRCRDEQCLRVEHLYLVELATSPMRRLWKRASGAGPGGWNRGTENVKAKLDEGQVAAIRQSHAAGATVGILALVYRVNESTIRRALKGKTWK